MIRTDEISCSESRRGADADRAVSIDRAHGGTYGENVLDFSVSINPLGPPPGALEAYHGVAAAISKYPPPYPDALTKRIADWLALAPENLVVGNGTTHLIYLIARVIRPRAPFIVIPTFSEIANALIAASVTPRAILSRAEHDFRIETGAVGASLERGADAIFIGRPNSPTGAMIAFDDAALIAHEASRRGAWCIFDEAFVDFAAGARSVAELVSRDPKAMVLRSLTKIFAIPGLRIGCLLAHRDTAAGLGAAIEPWSVNVAAERVALACLDCADDFIRRTQEIIAAERDHLARELSQIAGIRVFPSAANFLLIMALNEGSPGRFGRYMLDHGIAVRDLATLPGCGPGFYRIGVRLRPDNERLLECARRWTP